MLKPNSPVTANLIKARELIADEKNWCKGVLHGSGGRHCALGAISEVVGYEGYSVEAFTLGRAAESLFRVLATQVNDDLGHAAAMRMFDRAIELSLQNS